MSETQQEEECSSVCQSMCRSVCLHHALCIYACFCPSHSLFHTLEHSPEPCVDLSGWVTRRAVGFLTLLTYRASHQSELYSSASHFHYWLVAESSAPAGETLLTFKMLHIVRVSKITCTVISDVPYLQYNRWSGFELQNSWHGEKLKLRIWVIDKLRVVEGHQGLHVVQFKAKLIRLLKHLLLPSQADGQLRGLAEHWRWVAHLAQLEEDIRKRKI